MNCLNQSKLTQPWDEQWRRVEPTLTRPPVTEKHVVVTILVPTHQSQPCKTIHYTYNEKLEGLRCCDIFLINPKTHNPGVKCRVLEPILPQPMTEKLGCGDDYT